MSFLTNWLNSSGEQTSEKKTNAKVYNTFNEDSHSNPISKISSVSVTFPSNIISSVLSITKKEPLSSSSNSVGIDIYETYNTSGNFTIRSGTELQTFGHSATDSTKCCKICRKLYKEEENSEWVCKYHRGKFQASTTFTAIASLKRWSCCFKESENSEGCSIGKHEEDYRVTGILNTFGMEENSELESQHPQSPKKKHIIPKESKKEKRGEVTHQIQKEDTLQKLALQYNVSVGDIKRTNKLFSDQIYGKKILIIPKETN